METTTERTTYPDGSYAIAATIHHDGHTATAGGGYVSDRYVIAYCQGIPASVDTTTRHRPSTQPRYGKLTLWDGSVIGTYAILSAWRVNSWMNSHRYAVRATINGKHYHGRTFGDGCIVHLTRNKEQPMA